MSTLLAEVGSTKGTWILLRENERDIEIQTSGYNPHVHNERIFTQSLTHVKDQLNEKIDSIIYYGSGVSSEELATNIKHELAHTFGAENIEVQSDLLGAARACCGNAPGVIAILGTGSSCCIYDGQITESVYPALGYPMGDEGGGWRIGLAMITGYYYKEMPESLRQEFKELLPDSREELISYVRQSPTPNRYLASFAKFAGVQLSESWIADTVKHCLNTFIETHVVRLQPDVPIHFVGGIAGAFEDLLKPILSEHNLKMGNVISNPIDALVKFHSRT